MSVVRLQVVLALALASLAMIAAEQDSRPARSKPVAPSIETAIATLTQEAIAAKEAGRFDHPKPDFKDRFGQGIPEEDVLRAIASLQHRDWFVDAYIRWQLTSFDPPFREFTDRAFARFMDAAPRMVENPRADPRVLAALRQAEDAGPLGSAATQHLRESVEDLARRAMIAEEMNRPALEWRDWVATKLGETGQRPRQWMVERLASLIAAGWSVLQVKGDMSRDFSASISDDTFTEAQRRELIMQITRLVGPGRQLFEEVTYFANGTIRLTIHTSKVSTDNVDAWRKRLAGLDPG